MTVFLLAKLLQLALLSQFVQVHINGQHNHREKFRQSLRRVWHTPMEIDVRDMHRYCTGECFYSPKSCRDTLGDLNCKNIIAIQKYMPKCSDKPDSPSKDLCARVGHLFIVSLLRTLPPELVAASNMQSYKSYEGRTFRCSVKPFVAIAFSDNLEDSVTPTNVEESILGDVFYTCVTKDPYVTTWIKRTKPLDAKGEKTEPHCIDISADAARNPMSHSDSRRKRRGVSDENIRTTRETIDPESNPSLGPDIPLYFKKKSKRSNDPPLGQMYTQLLDTNPYPPMGSSVIWSKIMRLPEQYAMGCKFIISDKDEDLTIFLNGTADGLISPLEFTDEKEAGKVVSRMFFNTKIKIANGLAYSKDGIVENVIFGNKPAKAIALVDNLMDDASIDAFEGMSNWDLENMEVQTLPPEPFLQVEKNQLAMAAINETYDLCLSNNAMCFVRDDEKNCILRHGCHYLTAVKSLDSAFSRLRFYMLSQTVKREGIFSWIHPQGWSAVGFSNDTKMGRDLVYTCTYRGETNHVLATYNLDQQNIFHVEPGDWLKKPMYEPINFFLDMDTEAAMCIFDVLTTDVILQSFFYAPPNADPHAQNTWPRLHWYLQSHEFYVLLAQGINTYADDRISYHTYRTVSPQKFSEELYWEVVENNSCKQLNSYSHLIITLAMAFHSIIK